MGATTRRRTLAGAALAASLVLVPIAVPATAATPKVRLDASMGFAGTTRQGAPAPLRVLAESDGFFSGILRVTVQGPQNVVFIEQPLEVPGGSRKVIHLLLPRATTGDVSAIDKSGAVAGHATISGSTITTEPLIGVISVDAPPATSVPLPILGVDAKVVPVARELVDLGAEALRGLTHLVVEAEAGATLSPRQIAAITGYAQQGGDLVVAAASEAALRFLPAALRGTGGGDLRRTRDGLGNVTVALASLRSSAWRAGGAMWSRALRAQDVMRWAGDDLASNEWQESLSQSGRFRRPTIGWLLTFVLGYVALAGPVNFIVLARMKRRELAWITVPILAIVFAAGAFVAGRGVRNVPIVQGVAIVTIDGSGERDLVALGVLSRTGGTEHVRLSGDWLTDAILPGAGAADQIPRVVADRDGVDVGFNLSIGAFGTAAARRTRAIEAKSAGTLTVGSFQYKGTVRNPAPFALRGASVIVGSSVQSIGSMAPGQSSTVTVAETRRGPLSSIEEAFFENGFDSSVFGPRPDGFFALLRRARATAGLGEPGNAFLIGSAELAEASGSLGLGRVEGNMLVIAPLRLTYPAGADVPAAAIRRSVIDSDGILDPNFSPFAMIQNAKRSIVRFELPRRARELTLSTVDLGAIGFGKFGPINIDPNTGQPVAPEAVGKGTSLSFYDFKRKRWSALRVSGDSIHLDPAKAVSPEGDVLVRISSDFAMPVAAEGLSLTAVLA